MMHYKGYFAAVEFDPDDRILHGRVAGIKDVVNFFSKTVDGIEMEFHKSVDEYLAYCRRRGEKPEKPVSGRFVVRVDPDIHRALAAMSDVRNRSINSIVQELLQQSLPTPPEMPSRKPGRRRRRARAVA
jgi:predicted HicB family RNase H-like nuclease